MIRTVWLVRVFALLWLFTSGVPRAAAEPKEADEVVHALCGKQIALLGESPVHGFGETLKFKVELVQRLVTECHYNALVWESGTYDYLHIERTFNSGQVVTGAMISAAMGGLWANEEVQSLVPFLRQHVMAGNLILGGLDDQVGAGSYASREMSSDLVQPLPDEERSRCLPIFEKHLRWQYTDDAPYRPADKVRIVNCLNEVEGSLASVTGGKNPWIAEDRAVVESLRRNLARNFTEDDFTQPEQEVQWFNDRDRSMYLNFQSLRSRLPKHSKLIVWAATVHAAYDLDGVTGFEGRVPLGSYIKRDFGSRAFSLGFTARSGEYEFRHPPGKELAPAPETSLEGQLFTRRDGDTAYLSRKELRRYGAVAARVLGTGFSTAHWDRLVDGLVVFRKERPPVWLKR